MPYLTSQNWIPFVFPPNVRDDLIPDGVTNSFILSQEVPGGYESNITVFKQALIEDSLITGSPNIEFDGLTNSLIIAHPETAAAFSITRVDNFYEISGATNPSNNGIFRVLSVTYDGTEIVVGLDAGFVNEATGGSISVTLRKQAQWEILQPETDYTVSGTGINFHRVLVLAETPKEEDFLYVIHRGQATYNLVPSERSVGPNQLSENLRNFVVDIYTGDGVENTFNLSQFAVNSKALEVTLDGIASHGDIPDQSYVGEWELAPNGLSIVFDTPPGNGVEIFIKHLGFSTISRRQTLSPGQISSPGPGTVNSTSLANNAVTNPKLDNDSVDSRVIADDAVNGNHIRITQGNSLIADDSTNVEHPIITLDSSDELNFSSPSNIQNLQDVKATSLDVTGNITVAGSVDGVDVSNLSSLVTALQASVLDLQNQIDNIWSPGDIKAHMVDGGTPPGGWILCNGALYSTATYPELFAVIGYSHGGSGPQFAVPDLRGRSLVGQTASGTGSGWGNPGGRFGSLDHTHVQTAHTHTINHEHIVPGHYHTHSTSLGSSLNISSSGFHRTRIDHSHTGSVDSGGSHTHTVTDPGHNHNPTITGTYDGNNLANTSASGTGISGTNIDGAHFHSNIRTLTWFTSGAMNIPYDPSSPFRFLMGRIPDGFNSGGRVASNSSVLPGGDISFVASNGTHAHGITDPTHLHTIKKATTGISIQAGGSHVHTYTANLTNAFSIDNLTAFDDGIHIHTSSDLNGSLGNVNSGIDGNSPMNTTGQTVTVSGSTSPGPTGTSNHACQTVRYFIKI